MVNLIKKESIIKNISAKEVWQNNETHRIEEQKMSPFIAEHIDDISEITGYDLEVTDMELFVGDFRADIVCKDANTDDVIVIENQLENSDHAHLGKSLTYFSNLGAKAIVWICEKFRPEHIKAIETLNEITGTDFNFYAIELKFESYNSNDPYYYFNNIVVPTYINKISQSLKNNVSDGFKDICEFFDKFDTILKPYIKSCKHPKNKTYFKVNMLKNGFYFGLGIHTKENNKIWFEISKEHCSDDEYNAIKNIVDKLRNETEFDFEYSVGKKNKNISKFIAKIPFDYNNQNDIQKLIESCKFINDKFNIKLI